MPNSDEWQYSNHAIFCYSPFPCKDCKDRHENCHDECERYLAVKKQSEEISKKRREKASYLVYEHRR